MKISKYLVICTLIVMAQIWSIVYKTNNKNLIKMNELLMFTILLVLGFTCYGIFFLAIKWFDKI